MKEEDLAKLYFPKNGTFKNVLEHGFEDIGEGEGFEYIVGKLPGGTVKVVFEPHSSDFCSVEIDGVDGFGYTLVSWIP